MHEIRQSDFTRTYFNRLIVFYRVGNTFSFPVELIIIDLVKFQHLVSGLETHFINRMPTYYVSVLRLK